MGRMLDIGATIAEPFVRAFEAVVAGYEGENEEQQVLIAYGVCPVCEEYGATEGSRMYMACEPFI